MNAAIEMHDSKLAEVVSSPNGLIVRLDPAYVHRSALRPGFDGGSVWSQPVEIHFASGFIEGQLPELPCTLDDGSVSGGAEFRGMIPLPCVMATAVRFEARNLEGDLIVILGAGLEAKVVGEPIYIEEFPDAAPK
jgi:hypothetical protein